MTKKQPLFYGWYIVAGAFLILAVNYGVRYSFGIFLKPMSDEYGWSRSVVSLGVSFNMLAYSFFTIFIGQMVDRIRPSHIITMGTLAVSLGLMMVGFAANPLIFYLVYGLFCGLGAAGLGIVVCNSSVAKWFHEKRGMAIGIASMGISVGTMTLTPLSGYIAKTYGWRQGFLTLAILSFVIGIIVSRLLFDRSAAKAGTDNMEQKAVKEKKSPRTSPFPPSFSQIFAGFLVTDKQFWLISLSFGFAYLTIMSVFVHQVPYAIDHGINPITAASSLASLGLAAFGGQFFFGWLTDRVRDAKYVVAFGFLMMALGMFILLNMRSEAMLYLFSLVFGFGYGCLAPLPSIILAERFGDETLGALYGMFTFLIGIGGSIGPFWAGYMYDHFQSYHQVWILNIVMLIGVTGAILLLQSRKSSRC
ncbi:MAG: MFS transporter [Syntrophobacterales bacterium]|jgi:MFS family permease|nr:MFS transporter [Syntrophobacterales bacterium]